MVAGTDRKQSVALSGTANEKGGVSSRSLILRLLGLAWGYRLSVIKLVILQGFLLAMALGGLGFTGVGIDIMHHAIDPAAKGAHWPMGLHPPTHWPPIYQLLVAAGAILIIATLRFLLDRTSYNWKGELTQKIVIDLRTRVYDKLQRLSFVFFDANESGSIINRVTGDVQSVREFVDGVMVQVMMLCVSLAFFTGYMFSIHVGLTFACLATTPLLWIITVAFSRIVRPAYGQSRQLMDKAVLVLSENVQAVHVVKGFARQAEETQKFKTCNDQVTHQQRWIFWCVSIFVPLIGFLPQVNLIVLMLYGGYLYMQDKTGTLTLGTLFIFAGLLQKFSGEVGSLAQIANSIQRSLTGAQRVFEVLDTPVAIESPANPKPLGEAAGHVSFENVTFGYDADNDPAVDDVSFDVDAGQCVAILGATGAGKSTLLSLIPRFYDPDAGRVRVDGIDLRDCDLDELRRNIGIVFQESFLFSNTVAANIAFGHPKATRQQIEHAAKIASAHEFIIEDLSHGYETVLTESGGNLSGGQRQRLAIARALLLEPPILLMDDPTAAIDPETEHEILEAMARAMAGRTTFIVAHRLSTLRRADLVIVLERGRVVQMGTHAELMNTDGHYQNAAQLQIADDESKRLLGMVTGGRP